MWDGIMVDAKAKSSNGKDMMQAVMFEKLHGLIASGADAYLLHGETTLSVFHSADFDCGTAISASHNYLR